MSEYGGTPDPLMPFTSRFPLSPVQGRVEPSTVGPSGVESRPFGMRYAVRPVEAGKHSMRPTQKSRTKQTAITKDGQVTGYEPDIEYYVEMDEE